MSIELDKYQEDVVCHPDSDCLVIAGPGAGKTRSIVERISYLISQGVNPEKIVAISFTNDASDEITNRVAQRHDEGAKIHSKTTHSFCYGLFTEHFEFNNVCQPWTSRGILRSIFSEINYSGDMNSDSMLKTFNNVKRMTIDGGPLYEEDISEHLSGEEPGLGHIFKRYEDIKYDEEIMDFTDMIWQLWIGMLCNNYAKEVIQSKYSHIIVDESQDMSPLSLGTINCISKKAHLMLMGDPRQSIYDFRGASPDLVINMANQRQMEEKVLKNNYRSSKNIVNLTNRVIDDLSKLEIPNCDPIRCSTGKINFHEPDCQKSEAAKVISIIENSSIDLEDWAVLYRNNSQSGLIEVECMQNEIPYNVSGQPYWSLNEIKTCIDYLKLVNSNFEDIDAFKSVYNTPNRYLSRKIMDSIELQFNQDEGSDLIEVIEGIAEVKEGYQKSNLLSLKSDLQKLKLSGDSSPAHLIEGVIFKFMSLSRNEHFYDIDTGTSKDQRKANLDSLVTISSQYEDVSSFLKDLDKLDHSKSDEGLNLMTIHSSKGREFEGVMIIGFVDEILPHHNGDMNEESRVAYVALTRAEDEIHILEPKSYNGEASSTSPIINCVKMYADV